MIWEVVYTKRALDDLAKLPRNTAQRIVKKITYFRKQAKPLSFAKKLSNPAFGSYRFRVGDYRVIFDVNDRGQVTVLLVLSIKHRGKVYKF